MADFHHFTTSRIDGLSTSQRKSIYWYLLVSAHLDFTVWVNTSSNIDLFRGLLQQDSQLMTVSTQHISFRFFNSVRNHSSLSHRVRWWIASGLTPVNFISDIYLPQKNTEYLHISTMRILGRQLLDAISTLTSTPIVPKSWLIAPRNSKYSSISSNYSPIQLESSIRLSVGLDLWFGILSYPPDGFGFVSLVTLNRFGVRVFHCHWTLLYTKYYYHAQ